MFDDHEYHKNTHSVKHIMNLRTKISKLEFAKKRHNFMYLILTPKRTCLYVPKHGGAKFRLGKIFVSIK